MKAPKIKSATSEIGLEDTAVLHGKNGIHDLAPSPKILLVSGYLNKYLLIRCIPGNSLTGRALMIGSLFAMMQSGTA